MSPTDDPKRWLTRLVAESDPANGSGRASAATADMLARARALRDEGHGRRFTYSRKVFIPLTRLCRDVCHYCTFAATPHALPSPFLTEAEVLAIARAGRAAGCDEALFTLGDKPELRWPEARAFLDRLGHATTIDYLSAMCGRVLDETGLLPHANPGVLSPDEVAQLRRVSVSQGLMLESASQRLCERGGPHFGSPDKAPTVRLATIAAAGVLKVPFTSGILIGIGETREERLEALLALHALHLEHGHLQEVIVQNFRAKPRTAMADAPDASLDELAWTLALARLVFGPSMNIQAPPNLSPGQARTLIDAGINDWGGVSPVTPDHVNPEAPWPEVEALRAATARAGYQLVERLAAYPAYCRQPAHWFDPRVVPLLLRRMDTEGLARSDDWSAGRSGPVPVIAGPRAFADTDTGGTAGITAVHPAIIDRAIGIAIAAARRGDPLDEAMIVRLFAARGGEVAEVAAAADELRRTRNGDTVSYVVNRNINYTNVCHYGCRFCAFSKGRHGAQLRGPAYDLDDDEIARRVSEAWARGATEVCMQGGIHPDYTGETYLHILRVARQAAPGIHVHAFSPLEVSHGAATLGLTAEAFLGRLRDAGLGTLPGTAAEILDDEVREVLCPDKLRTGEWMDVMAAAHRVGLRSTATIMFGHLERSEHWARHLLRVRALQQRTGGFTEFVPLPFIHMEAPVYLKGRARPGPTWREALLMHAVARLALSPVIDNIQCSWVKLGPEGVVAALGAGVNDLGGTLMNESISFAAGNQHGQELAPPQMEALIRRASREPVQRTTLYAMAPVERRTAAASARPLSPVVQTPLRRRSRLPRAAAATVTTTAATSTAATVAAGTDTTSITAPTTHAAAQPAAPSATIATYPTSLTTTDA